MTVINFIIHFLKLPTKAVIISREQKGTRLADV